MEIGVVVVLAPALSTARALTEYVPLPTFVQLKVYGDELSEPRTVEPLRKSTRDTVPSGSLAVAAKLTVAGAVNVWPAVGVVRPTVGGRFPPDGEALGDGLLALPVQATPLSAKFVGCGNGLGGAEPPAVRVQLPCRPTVALVAPVPIEPFQPASVALIAVVPVNVAFQPPVRVCPLGSV